MIWLMKSEPTCYSIDDLEREGKTHWDGVRNFQARNFMRDEMQVDELALFYHSNAKPPGVAGIAKISRTGYPDHTAFDPKDDHYDHKSDPDNPKWIMVDITFVKKFPRIVTLAEMRTIPELQEMMLLKKGMRLSIQKVTQNQFNTICNLAESHEPVHS
jgi:predicted RNA-binding protein with PUA-like domain